MPESADTPCHALPKNFLRPCVLLLLREHSAHGYELMDRLRALGFDHDDHGRLYRTLRHLEADGQVVSSWAASHSGPHRRIYELTELGAAELRDDARELAAASGFLDAFLCRCAEMHVTADLPH